MSATSSSDVFSNSSSGDTAFVQGVDGRQQVDSVYRKDIKVPDNMVGLIIGRCGERITRLQAESGCKIQMAPNSGGSSERTCTLTGRSQENIAHAEELIQQVLKPRVAPRSTEDSNP